MSNYKNMTIDFPTRILDIIKDYYLESKRTNKDVTFIIALANSAITIPLERLNDNHISQIHEHYSELKELKTSLIETSFFDSIIWPSQLPRAWYYGGPYSVSDGLPDDLERLLESTPIAPDFPTMGVLKHLRNALAHGNVYTFGEPDITKIVFLSWKSGEERYVQPDKQQYMYIYTSPEYFTLFLVKWLTLLEPIRFTNNLFPEINE